MTAWYNDARFDIFTECDVFADNDGSYLLAMNEAFNYYGDYTCCSYYCHAGYDGTNKYSRGEHFGAGNWCISDLEKAPWSIARDIISCYLIEWASHEDSHKALPILDAEDCLMNYATEIKKFIYC